MHDSDGRFCRSVEGKCVQLLSGDHLERQFLADLATEIRTLETHGKRVIVSLPFPTYAERIPDIEISNAVFGPFGLWETPTPLHTSSFSAKIREVAVGEGADIYDPRETLCPRGQCITETGGVSICKDSHHTAGSQVCLLEDSMRQVPQHAPATHRPNTSSSRAHSAAVEAF